MQLVRMGLMLAEGDDDVELDPEAYAAGIDGAEVENESDVGYKARCCKCGTFWPIPGELVPILQAPGARKLFCSTVKQKCS